MHEKCAAMCMTSCSVSRREGIVCANQASESKNKILSNKTTGRLWVNYPSIILLSDSRLTYPLRRQTAHWRPNISHTQLQTPRSQQGVPASPSFHSGKPQTLSVSGNTSTFGIMDPSSSKPVLLPGIWTWYLTPLNNQSTLNTPLLSIFCMCVKKQTNLENFRRVHVPWAHTRTPPGERNKESNSPPRLGSVVGEAVI